MEEVYDIYQYSCLALIRIENEKARINLCSTTEKKIPGSDITISSDSCITYDKQKMNIKSWGLEHSESDGEDDICIDNFIDELYRVFKKDKNEWNEDDLFLLKAVSDFIRLLVEVQIGNPKGELKSTDQLHYVFVVPSEWEEEIRETLLRPIFVQSNLISKDDHNDRLLFCSEIESIFYELMDKNEFDFEKIRKTILCRFVCPVSEDEILIKLDLVSPVNRLFDFPDSLLYPNVKCSNQLTLTIYTFTDGIRAFTKDELPFPIQEEIIQIIMDEKDEDYLKPLITDTSRWELDKRQLEFIESICILNICSQICKNTTNNIDVLLLNDIIKKYNFLSCYSFSFEREPNKNLLNWSRYLPTHNRTCSRNENIIYPSFSRNRKTYYYDYMASACLYGRDAINNANIYCRPRILPVKNSANSSSIFQESKPDAIMNIDISIESTILSFSFLNEKGFVKEIWNHDDFLKDKRFIKFAKDYLIGDISFFPNRKKTVLLRLTDFMKDYLKGGISFLSCDKKDGLLELNAANIEAMLRKDNDDEDVLVSTQQQIYIEAFVLLYMNYIKYVTSSKLSNIIDLNTEMKIGYNITVEKILLDRLFDTKEGLKDIIYASGLIQKDDNFKKLRIITEGERILHLLKRSLALPFPLKSYFVLAQLHENYIQLTLKQVVTEFSPSEDQEAIIIHDKIIHIPNIYNSLCLNMWNNILENSSSIKLCHIHQEYSGDNLLEITSLKNQAEFTENLKQYISRDNLGNSSNQSATGEIDIPLSVSCSRSVHLAVLDIIDISFQPILQDIASLVFASFINTELFGNFWNIQYLFQLIQFEYNTQLHDSLIKMVNETTEDVIIEQGVGIPHYIISKSLNQLLQPVLHQRPISYKEFQVDTLRQVHGDEYGFCIEQRGITVPLVYKNKTTDTNPVSINERTVFPLFKKGDLINDLSKTLHFI